MSNILHAKQGWVRALIFFFVGMSAGGIIATPIETLIEKGYLGDKCWWIDCHSN